MPGQEMIDEVPGAGEKTEQPAEPAEAITNVPGASEGAAEQPVAQPELITGVPKELGGDAVRAAAEADQKAAEEERARNPLSAGYTVIKAKIPPQITPEK